MIMRQSLRILMLGAATLLPVQVAVAQARADPDPSATGSQQDDIIVTAQKRSEKLQDVPLSISVIQGEALRQQGAASLVDYAAYVPGLKVLSSQPGDSTISLRGISPVGSAQAVGVYLDDAPVGSSSLYARAATYSLDLLPYDIQSVEVLRGPQGTLYGASSIGGLLKYVTVTPSLTELSVRGGGELLAVERAGDLGGAAQVLVNAPLVRDRLGVTASFAWRKTPGFVESSNNPRLNDQNGVEQSGGRVALLWKPTDALTVRLSGLWQSIRSNGVNRVGADLDGRPLGGDFAGVNFVPEPFRKSIDFYTAALDYDLAFATLSSVSTYSDTRTSSTQDATLVYAPVNPFPGTTPFEVGLRLKKYTQEIRLTSPGGGAFEWMLGAFYTDEDSDNRQVVRSFLPSGNPTPIDPAAVAAVPSTYKEYAAFANATVRLSKVFDISAGVRVARNEQTFSQVLDGALIGGLISFAGDSDESVFIYSLSPRVHLGDDIMIYGRVANGYRPGGPNIAFPGVPPQVKADKLVNYEVGLKASLFDRALTIDAAAFYMDWSDIQVTQDFGGVTAAGNGPSAVSKGFEGTMSWRPSRGLTLTANAAYTDARLTADAPSISGLDEDRLPFVPEFSASARADYTFRPGDRVEARFGGGVRYVDAVLSAPRSSPDALASDAYAAVDLDAALTFGERWTLRAYVRNLTNNDAATQRQFLLDATLQPVLQYSTVLQPRTIGLGAEFAF